MECIKDAYSNPYIPGSSLKGMFRTIILGADIINMAHKYQNAGQDLIRNLNNRNLNIKNLDKDIKNIEGIKYRTLHRERTQPLDAVNDVLQGFLVSDSEPLTVDSLVLCQKVDIHIKGAEKRMAAQLKRPLKQPGQQEKEHSQYKQMHMQGSKHRNAVKMIEFGKFPEKYTASQRSNRIEKGGRKQFFYHKKSSHPFPQMTVQIHSPFSPSL